MIQDLEDLYQRLKLRHFGVLQKIEIINYVWDIDLEWTPEVEEEEHYLYLNRLIDYYNNHFFRDIEKYGQPATDYDKEMASLLEDLRNERIKEISKELAEEVQAA